jgi:hypothetical protein
LDLIDRIEALTITLTEQEEGIEEANGQYKAILLINHTQQERFNELSAKEIDVKAAKSALIKEQLKLNAEVRTRPVLRTTLYRF